MIDVSDMTVDEMISLKNRIEIRIGERNNEEQIKSVVLACCDILKIKEKDFLSKSREEQLVDARRICSMICRGMEITYTKIAKHTLKHHSTIIYHCQTGSNYLKSEADFKVMYELIKSKLQ